MARKARKFAPAYADFLSFPFRENLRRWKELAEQSKEEQLKKAELKAAAIEAAKDADEARIKNAAENKESAEEKDSSVEKSDQNNDCEERTSS